jgi:hypothetical protein
LKKKITKKITLIFTMNLLTNRIIFVKTGLLLLAILFFLGCKKAQNKIGLDDPSRFPTNTFFTDTLTIKSEVILINDSIRTTNVVSDTNFIMLAGSYLDPYLGPVAAETYTRLHLVEEHVELPAATADSAFLYLRYHYFYGDSTFLQTLNIYKMTEIIKPDTIYYSSSPGLSYDPTPVGSITFNAVSDTSQSAILKIRITDMTFLQSILNASKNNTDFSTEIPGLAFIAGSTEGTIIRINGSAPHTMFQLYYSQYGTSGNIYNMRIGGAAKKFFRIVTDRSSTALASLKNNYQSVVPSNNLCYIQACVGISTKITIPYLKNLLIQHPTLVIASAILYIAPKQNSIPVDVFTNTKQYPSNPELVLIRTGFDAVHNRYSILKNTNLLPYYVQPDDHSQIVNTLISIAVPDSTYNVYSFPIRSYLQAVLLNQIDNNPLIISPLASNFNIDRLIFNDNTPAVHLPEHQGIKLNLYYTVAK